MKVFQRRLKYVATVNDETLAEDTPAEFELQYVDISNVDSSGNIVELATYTFADAPSRARRRVRDGDVIISTVRTYLQAIAHITKPPDNLIVSTGFAVIRPRPHVFDAQYCKYALRESGFLAEVERRSVGISYPAINASDLAAIPVHLHPLPQQRAIACYLEREITRLDQLIIAKKELLNVLAEKRRGMVACAVLRGLDLDIRRRDSDIPWLGEIPAHWESKRAKWLFTERDERSSEGDEQLLSLRMERGLVPHNEVSDKSIPSQDLIGYKRVRKGQIVINRMRAASGLIAVSPQDGIVSPDYAVFECDLHVDQNYYIHLFKTDLLQAVFRSESKGLGTGSSGFLRLYSENFLSLWFPYPPLEEQREIVTYVENEIFKWDALKSGAECTISLLKERRASLITAAVTGKIPLKQKGVQHEDT